MCVKLNIWSVWNCPEVMWGMISLNETYFDRQGCGKKWTTATNGWLTRLLRWESAWALFLTVFDSHCEFRAFLGESSWALFYLFVGVILRYFSDIFLSFKTSSQVLIRQAQVLIWKASVKGYKMFNVASLLFFNKLSSQQLLIRLTKWTRKVEPLISTWGSLVSHH